jgi:hypothetical protein
MRSTRENISPSRAETNPIVDFSFQELTDYIEQERIDLQGKPRQPGWISAEEYAQQQGISHSAAAHVLDTLTGAGKLLMERVYDGESHRTIKVYCKPA